MRLRVLHMLTAAGLLAGALAAPAAADPNCKCRFQGTRYELGTVMCIMGKLARCEMLLNNTSWKPIANTCPQASAPMTPRPGKAAHASTAAG